MKPEQITETLESAAKQMGVQVRYETMTGEVSGGGGLCKVKGQWCVIIDRKVAPAERAATLTEALAQLDTDGVFLPPEVRDALTAARAASARPAATRPCRLGQPTRSASTVIRCARFQRRRTGPGSSSAYAPEGLESSGGTTEPPDSASAEKLPGPVRPRVPPRSAGTAPTSQAAPASRRSRVHASRVHASPSARPSASARCTRPTHGAERCSSTSEGDGCSVGRS